MRPGDFSYPSRYLKVLGYNLHYLDQGEGEPILLLHGNPTWGYLWRLFLPELSRNYRCVVPDFLGFGLSDKPTGADYGLAAQQQRLSRFVDKLGLQEITLMGHDIGGIIGLSWAAENKERVKRLVLMNTSGTVPEVLGGNRYRIPWSYLVLWPLRLPGLGEGLVQGLNFLQRVVMPAAFWGRQFFSKEVRRGFAAPYRGWRDRKAQLVTVRQIPIWKSDPVYQMLYKTGRSLAGWQVPTQNIWGMKDPSFPPWIIHDLERLLPNHGITLRLPGAGHFLTEEKPEEILKQIKGFLQNTGVRMN